MDLLREAHEHAKETQEDVLKFILTKFPHLSSEFEYNIKKYGSPVLSSAEGGLCKEELAAKLQELLYKQFPHELIEISIKPEDEDAHHWSVYYNILTPAAGVLVRAIDYERQKSISLNNKPLFYLTHNDKSIFSGYGITISNDKKNLVGLLMIDRPEKANEEWLNLIYEQFGELTLMVMSNKGERGIFCQMEIHDNSLDKIIELNADMDIGIKKSLFRYRDDLPAPYFNMEWDYEKKMWKSEPVKNEG